MSRLITKRPKRAVQRHETHAYAEITRIVRVSYNVWEANVEYAYGRSTWIERVSFVRTPRTRKQDVIVITDSDYPTDRACRIMVDGKVDMVSTITTFIIAGRW